MLGSKSQIYIYSRDISTSYQFYSTLGFRRLDGGDDWKHLTDGQLSLMLYKQDNPGIGLVYYNSQLLTAIKHLEAFGIGYRTMQEGRDTVISFVSPDGLNIAITDYDPEKVEQPPLRIYTDIEQFKLDEPYKDTIIGFFGEFCHKVTDLKKSLLFWKTIGYEPTLVQEKPYPWAIITDGLNIVGLHQTTDFSVPAITFFAPDMGARIRNVRSKGISTNQFGGTGGNENNVVVDTPEGQKLFLFSF